MSDLPEVPRSSVRGMREWRRACIHELIAPNRRFPGAGIAAMAMHYAGFEVNLMYPEGTLSHAVCLRDVTVLAKSDDRGKTICQAAKSVTEAMFLVIAEWWFANEGPIPVKDEEAAA